MDFKKLLQFLTELKKNNHKAWFDDHRKQYEELRQEWIEFVKDSIAAIGTTDASVLHLEPKKCIFKINRDIRFSKDKSPYKTNFGMSLNPNGKKEEFMGYYLHIEPDNCFFAGGSYKPQPATLAAIRQEIDYNFKQFESIVTAKIFKKYFGTLDGEQLSRPPKGYEADNPAIHYLKYKSFIGTRKFTQEEVLSKNFNKTLLQTATALKPLLDFIRESVQQ
jgi:uncharacterized protein (TIGR02453 family)